VLRFTAAAYVGVIQWWLKDDMQYSPKFMAKQVVWLYTFGVYKALGINSAISADTFIQNQLNE